MVQLKGGLWGTLKKASKVARREGLGGVLKRFAEIAAKIGSANYTLWVRRYDTLSDATRAKMLERAGSFAAKPLISVLMPTYNPRPEWLAEAIESVRGQIYPNWELCIADDASTDQRIRPLLEHYAAQDERIKVAFRNKNGHISEASNTALKLAKGKWIALLDHDDLLSEHALFWVADAIRRDPRLRLLYSDEDKVDERGSRRDPYFKCDWNPDLFRSQNFITHLCVYQADLIRRAGGFRRGLEGAQDYDLALRCVERLLPEEIHHIPRILYHWRIHALSTAQSTDHKPYANLAGLKALNDHFKRTRQKAKAESAGIFLRARYPLPRKAPWVSLIIPTRNGLNLLKTCVESILQRTAYPRYEILIVDNGSDDPETLRYLEDLGKNEKIKILRDDSPFNYPSLNNGAVRNAKGTLIGLLNNDLEVISPDWLSEMASQALRPEIGAVGAKLYYPNHRIQHAGVILGIGGVAGHPHKHFRREDYGYFSRAVLVQNFSAVTAACLVVRKSVYNEVGGMDERNLRVAFNDVDFCLKVREKGYRNLFTPYAEFFHHESATRGDEDTPGKKARFAKEVHFMMNRWGGLLQNDPAYNPNLTLDQDDLGLAWPPRVPEI